MDIDSIISRVGFIITVGSAIYTGIQAAKAKKIKDEIKDTRKKLYLESLLKKGQIARDESKKICNTSNNGKSSRGIDFDISVNEIQSFIESLLDKLHIFSNREKLESVTKNVQESILKLKSETDIIEKQKISNNVYRKLNEIIPILQELFDE